MPSPEFVPSPEVPRKTDYPRFEEDNLSEVSHARNNWLGVSYTFTDGTELLTLNQLTSRAEYEAARSSEGFRPAEVLQEGSHVVALDKKLGSHVSGQHGLFESKFKIKDADAIKSANILIGLTQPVEGRLPYKFPRFTAKTVEGIRDGVKAHRRMRTYKLLEDFDQLLSSLGDTPVWMRAHAREDYSAVFAAQLAGFVIRTTEEYTAIEPVIVGIDGSTGLFPDTVFIEPNLNIRV